MKTQRRNSPKHYTFSCHDINKFILLLGKGADPYEYMNDWEKSKVRFYSHLNMEDNTDADYTHTRSL